MGIFGKIIIIMGIFGFARQAPKLISEIIGIDAGNIKLGIREKLASGGAFVAGGLLGAGATSMVRNLTNKWADKDKWKNASGNVTARSVARNLFGGAISGVAGGVSGAARGGYGARGAKNFTDMRNSASKGAQGATEARMNRENYRANHGGYIGAMGEHITDTGRSIGNWLGLSAPLEQLKIEQNHAQEVKNARKAVDERLKAIMERDALNRDATRSINVNGTTVGYSNLSELRNDIERIKNGHTAMGGTLTSTNLISMQRAEKELEKQLKNDILNGYDKHGTRITRANFNTDYDGELQALLTSYRTKASQYANVISTNTSNDIASQTSLENFRTQAIDNQNASLAEFILTDVAHNHYDSATGTTVTRTDSLVDILVNEGNASINNANTNINNRVNERIQRNNDNNS